MKKKWIIWVCCCVFIFLSFVGCQPLNEQSFRFYEKASEYTFGEFSCAGEGVKKVVIDWLDGDVEIEQSATDGVFVFEEDNALSDEKRVHTYLNDGVLQVKYCQSGYLGKIDPTQKDLQVELPKGIDVEIRCLRANVYLGGVDVGEIFVQTEKGVIEGERIAFNTADLSTKNGHIGIGALQGERANLCSLSGDIHIGDSLCRQTEIKTENGDVILYLQGDVSALIDFQTQGGVIKTKQNYEKEEGKYLFFEERSERVFVEVTMKDGDLCII